MRGLLLLLTALLLGQAALAEPAAWLDPAAVQSLTAGIFCKAGPGVPSDEPGTIPGTFKRIDQPSLIAPTQRIPDADGLLFGVDERLAPRLRDRLVLTVDHPPFGPQAVTRESWTSVVHPKGTTFHGYALGGLGGDPKGHWVISGQRRGKLVFRVEFEVVRATQAERDRYRDCATGY